jgi:tetratricopeptide (TPR) repeat protein
LKNILVIVTASALLSACTGWSPTLASLPEDRIAAPVAAVDQEITAKADTEKNEGVLPPVLPSIRLDENILFKVISSEVAYQRGQWQAAYVTMLGLAQQTRDPRLARRATEIALGAKQSTEALAAVRLWLELEPRSEDANQYYLGFVILSENLIEAQAILAERLENTLPPARGLLMFQIQRLLSRAKDKPAAFSILEQLLAPYGTTLEAHLALAQGAMVKGDSRRAQEEAQAALTIQPDSELAALTFVQVTTDRQAASTFMDDFLASHPNAGDARLIYARLLVDHQEYDKARTEFQALLKARPQDLNALYALGVLSMQTNNTPEAERYLTMYLNTLSAHPEEERDPTQALLMLAQIAEEHKDPNAALNWLSQIEPGGAYLGAQLRRAQLIAKNSGIESARKLLHDLHPEGEAEKVQVTVAEAQILRDANQLQQAMTVLETGLKLFPNNTDLLYDYAMMAEKLNKLTLMETVLRKMIKLAPKNQQAYNALGYSLAERNLRLPEAYTLIEKALQLTPEDPFIIDSMGWVQFRLGKLKEAEELLRRAYTLRPDTEIGVHLGEVLWVKGDKEAAQTLWRDIQVKEPQNDLLKSTLARLHVRL